MIESLINYFKPYFKMHVSVFIAISNK